MKQLCPKCGGQGHVNVPPWVAGDQPTWTTNTTTTYTCRACDGKGVIDA